jgi:hypothetical protein
VVGITDGDTLTPPEAGAQGDEDPFGRDRTPESQRTPPWRGGSSVAEPVAKPGKQSRQLLSRGRSWTGRTESDRIGTELAGFASELTTASMGEPNEAPSGRQECPGQD